MCGWPRDDAVALIGDGVTVAVAADIWFHRYDLLTKDNVDSGLPNGAHQGARPDDTTAYEPIPAAPEVLP